MLVPALAQLTLVAQGGLLHGGGVVIPDPQRTVTLQHVQLQKNYYYNEIVIKGEYIKRTVTLQHVQLEKIGGKNCKDDTQITYVSAIGRSVGVGQELSKLSQQILLVLEQLGHLGVDLCLRQRLTRRGDNPLQWSTQLI